MLRHSLQNDSRMKRRPFDRREQLILRGVHQVPAQRHAAQLRIHQHRAIAVVPAQPQQPRLSRRDISPAPAKASTPSVPARRAIASKMSPVAESPASIPKYAGCTLLSPLRTRPAPARVLRHRNDASRRADHIDHIALANIRPHRIPVRIERAHRNRDPRAQSQMSPPTPPSDARRACPMVRYSPPIFARTPANSGSTADQKIFRRKPAPLRIPHPLVPHRANAALGRPRSVTPHSIAATMSQCSNAVDKLRALLRIVPQPVQQLRKSPLIRINAAAPVDRLKASPMRRARNLLRLVQARDDRTTGSNRPAAPAPRPPESRSTPSYRARSLHRLALHPAFSSTSAWPSPAPPSDPHATASQNPGRPACASADTRRRRAQPAPFAIQHRHPHAQRSKIHSRHDCHSNLPPDGLCPSQLPIFLRFLISKHLLNAPGWVL